MPHFDYVFVDQEFDALFRAEQRMGSVFTVLPFSLPLRLPGAVASHVHRGATCQNEASKGNGSPWLGPGGGSFFPASPGWWPFLYLAAPSPILE